MWDMEEKMSFAYVPNYHEPIMLRTRADPMAIAARAAVESLKKKKSDFHTYQLNDGK